MTGINLLPWREELRKIKNNAFFALMGVSVATGLLLVFLADFVLQQWIDTENKNIAYIQEEQKSITSKIKEIQGLQKDKEDLLHRREIIQTLQANRPLVVRMLDTLPRITPEGVVLTSMERKGSQITILGTAQTPSSISTLFKNLEDKHWNNLFTNIKINEIERDKEQTGVGFILEFTLSNPI